MPVGEGYTIGLAFGRRAAKHDTSTWCSLETEPKGQDHAIGENILPDGMVRDDGKLRRPKELNRRLGQERARQVARAGGRTRQLVAQGGAKLYDQLRHQEEPEWSSDSYNRVGSSMA